MSKKKLYSCVMFKGKVVHEGETANHQSAIMALLEHWEEAYEIDIVKCLSVRRIPDNIRFHWLMPAKL